MDKQKQTNTKTDTGDYITFLAEVPVVICLSLTTAQGVHFTDMAYVTRKSFVE